MLDESEGQCYSKVSQVKRTRRGQISTGYCQNDLVGSVNGKTSAVQIRGKELAVRLVRREERAHWRELMREHHYLGFDSIIGESLWYVASVGNEWVALLGWGSAALKCGVRDQWVGWDRELEWGGVELVGDY